MVSVTGKTPAEIIDTLEEEYGHFDMVEDNMQFAPEHKQRIMDMVFTEKLVPDFKTEIEKISYEDGCKVYFTNGDFVICRFSGTEPLLRIFAESSNETTAAGYITAFKELLKI